MIFSSNYNIKIYFLSKVSVMSLAADPGVASWMPV